MFLFFSFFFRENRSFDVIGHDQRQPLCRKKKKQNLPSKKTTAMDVHVRAPADQPLSLFSSHFLFLFKLPPPPTFAFCKKSKCKPVACSSPGSCWCIWLSVMWYFFSPFFRQTTTFAPRGRSLWSIWEAQSGKTALFLASQRRSNICLLCLVGDFFFFFLKKCFYIFFFFIFFFLSEHLRDSRNFGEGFAGGVCVAVGGGGGNMATF